MSLQATLDRVRLIQETFDADKGALWRALDQIAETPHRALLIEYPLVSSGEAESIVPERMLDSLLEPEAVSITGRRAHFKHRDQSWRFLQVFDQRARATEATLPNQVTAYLLRMLLTELRRHLPILRAQGESGHGALDDALRLQRRLHGLLQRSDALNQAQALRELPLDNNVLNHHPLYRQVLFAYLKLLRDSSVKPNPL